MSVRIEGKRIAASTTTVVSVVTVLIAGAGSLVLWHQTEQAKNPTATVQQSDDGSSSTGDSGGQSGFVSQGQGGGIQSQSSGS